MAEVLPTNRYVVALGPIKMEVLNFTGTITTADSAGNPSTTTQTGVDTADTFKTLIQNPKFAMVVADSDSSDTAWSTSFSGKTCTLTNTGASAVNIRVLVFGT